MIQYKEFDSSYIQEVKTIYKQYAWNAYLKDDNKLKLAFDNSIYVLGAFKENELIGFVRCVGDAQHIVLVQDLIVKREYTRQQIGSKLLESASQRYHDVRAFYIVTDQFDKEAIAFYQSQNYKPFIDKALIGFLRG